MVGENALDRAKQNNIVKESQNILSAKEDYGESTKVNPNDESAIVVKRFSLQQNNFAVTSICSGKRPGVT